MRSLILVFVMSSSIIYAQTKRPYDSTDYTISGLSNSSDDAQVLKRLGEPDTVISINAYPLGMQVWFYSGMEIHLVFVPQTVDSISSHILYIQVNSAKYKTRRGLRVCDPVSNVLKLYGKPTEETEEGMWLYFHKDHPERMMGLIMKNGFVSRMLFGEFKRGKSSPSNRIIFDPRDRMFHKDTGRVR